MKGQSEADELKGANPRPNSGFDSRDGGPPSLERQVAFVRTLVQANPELNLYQYAFECPEIEGAALLVARELENSDGGQATEEIEAALANKPLDADVLASRIVDGWHEECFGLRIDNWKLRELKRRIAVALVGEPADRTPALTQPHSSEP